MKYAFLGAGRMALALVQGMLRAGVCRNSDVTVSSRSEAGLDSLVSATGVHRAGSNSEASEAADVVMLCVKPGDAARALRDAGAGLSGRLLISVVTGLKIKTLEAAAPGARVIRAMPNTPASVGRGVAALASGSSATEHDEELARAVFAAVGKVFRVEEHQLDAITGLSGSGPAFVYLLMEALSDGGVAAGLPRKLALELAIQTVAGAAEMAAVTGEHPALLREMVTSPGGTTIAGLGVLESEGVRSAFLKAVVAAAQRSKELA